MRGTLVDEIFGATYHPEKRFGNPFFEDPSGSRKVALKVRAALTSARRYFLEDEVVRSATKLGVQHPDILFAMLSRARLPFTKVWIEWNQNTVLNEQGLDVDTHAPPRCGAYLEEISGAGEAPIYRMTELALAYDVDPPQAVAHSTSIVFALDAPILDRMPIVYQERSDLSRLTGVSKEVMDRCLLGSAYSEKAENGISLIFDRDILSEATKHRLELCRNLASYASHVFSPFWPDYQQITKSSRTSYNAYEKHLNHGIVEFSGTWRFLISVFALIQARDFTSYVQPPSNAARRRFVGNKVVPYLQHWRVALNLPREVVLRKMISSTRDALPRARHEVEGHWKTSHKGDPNCLHVDVSETPNRYRCALCNRARWWQSQHLRGSSEIGFVTKDRVVQKRS